jgi:DNA-binding transcriptional ArsR family regulator
MKALRHRLRRQILRALHAAKEARSPRELADALGCKRSNVSYHVGILQELHVVALTDEVPRGGTTERFYASTVSEDGGLCLVLIATERSDEGR